MILNFEKLSSTNDYLKEQLDTLEHGTVVVAKRQPAGKGRLGKNWVDLPGNIHMSILYKQQTGDVSFFPLLCAVAVSTVLERSCGCQVQIKWPNDLLLNNKKICGILCESVMRGSQLHIICGIGVNVNLQTEQLAQEALCYATSLQKELGKTYALPSLVEEIATEMEAVIARFQTAGFSPFRSIYESKLVNRGKQVRVVYQNKEQEALCLGIAENGNLCCECAGETFSVHSGEASVRGLYGYV